MELRILDLTLLERGIPMEECIVAPPLPPVKKRKRRKRRDRPSRFLSKMEHAMNEQGWVRELYSRRCEFCGRAGQHYDHIQMFDKIDSVSSMIVRGEPKEVILAEAAKCQMLCRQCHAKVTKKEMAAGFFKIKRGLKGVPADEAVRASYMAVMGPFYEGLRRAAGELSGSDNGGSGDDADCDTN